MYIELESNGTAQHSTVQVGDYRYYIRICDVCSVLRVNSRSKMKEFKYRHELFSYVGREYTA